MPLYEKVIVDYISGFFDQHSPSEKNLKENIKKYVDSLNNLSGEDNAELQLAIDIQAKAMQTLEKMLKEHPPIKPIPKSATLKHIKMPEHYFDPWGYAALEESICNYVAKRGWVKPALMASGFVVAIIAPAVYGFSIGLAATYGLAKDIFESGEEIFRNQRVKANLITLAVAITCIALASVAMAAIFASNPVGWGIIAGGFLMAAAALTVKIVRAAVNSIDSHLDKKSALYTDSRFQLSDKEAKKLEELGWDVIKVKNVIRGLALEASKTPRTGFFGTKDKYKGIIDLLSDVKRGAIPPDICEQYEIEAPPAKATPTKGS